MTYDPGHPRQEDAEVLFLLGNSRLENGDYGGAEACFREALQLEPQCAEACANLALMLERRGTIDEAEACYRQALALNPEMAGCLSNLGNLLVNQKRLGEAEQAYLRTLEFAPEWPVAWTHLGALYASMQRENEAERCHRRAIEIDPGYATARFNLSYLLLRQGRFDEGWQCLDARDWYAKLAALVPCPRWQGEALAGKSLLIGFEAGHGDMIQLCRYVPLLKAQGAARVDLLCHPGLVRLFETLDGVDDVRSCAEDLPAAGWHFWTPPFSIPFHLKTRLETIPAKLPYLHADAARAEQWRQRLPAGGLRVGLAWKGNPLYENDADRSLPNLNLLSPLRDVPGMQFISLQKGAGEGETEQFAAEWPLCNFGPELEDFADTAGLIANLDLVISVDTAVAHLAGALGKRCWLLLPDYMTDWRWLTGRDDTPWYPGVTRLFRQSQKRDWAETIAQVKLALERLPP
ncbi:MAG: repeat-containing protein [Burkholderiaceae bacterium]|nr:repeat-containing protein [Burkholderiaceae bacterium]